MNFLNLIKLGGRHMHRVHGSDAREGKNHSTPCDDLTDILIRLIQMSRYLRVQTSNYQDI